MEPEPLLSNQQEEQRRNCQVCGDFGTGKHYGAWTCYGCKGFFQRTVRKGTVYICRFGSGNNCIVTKEKRNQCRACRFRKSLEVGMLREAVQNERESLPPRKDVLLQIPPTSVVTNEQGKITVPLLIEAENVAKQMIMGNYPSLFPQVNLLSRITNPIFLPVAEPQEIYETLKMEMELAVEWAKRIPGFRELTIENQIALLRNHCVELAVLQLVRGSMHTEGCLVLPNGKRIVPEPDKVRKISLVRFRTIDEILKPCQRLKVQDSEFLCLLALILFDPEAASLADADRGKVGEIREQLSLLLEDPTKKGRPQALLLVLPSLYCISLQLLEILKKMKLSGLWQLPRLIEEMYLSDSVDWYNIDLEDYCEDDPTDTSHSLQGDDINLNYIMNNAF